MLLYTYMRRTQLYLPEEYHQLLTHLAQNRGETLSEEVRRAITEYLTKREIKKMAEEIEKKKKPKETSKGQFADMIGVFTGPKDSASSVDEIYD